MERSSSLTLAMLNTPSCIVVNFPSTRWWRPTDRPVSVSPVRTQTGDDRPPLGITVGGLLHGRDAVEDRFACNVAAELQFQWYNVGLEQLSYSARVWDGKENRAREQYYRKSNHNHFCVFNVLQLNELTHQFLNWFTELLRSWVKTITNFKEYRCVKLS